MELGAKIKLIRKQKKISIEKMAEALGVSVSTIYRYEDSSIQKIPVNNIEKICDVLGITFGELMNTSEEAALENTQDNIKLPKQFENAQEAMEFMLRLPSLAAYGGYDPSSMSDETIIEFANTILQQIELVSHKYRK